MKCLCYALYIKFLNSLEVLQMSLFRFFYCLDRTHSPKALCWGPGSQLRKVRVNRRKFGHLQYALEGTIATQLLLPSPLDSWRSQDECFLPTMWSLLWCHDLHRPEGKWGSWPSCETAEFTNNNESFLRPSHFSLIFYHSDRKQAQ